MIQNLNTYSSPWLVVTQSQSKPYFSNSGASAGIMRYNNGNGCVEVYDGSSWLTLSGHAEINVSPQTQQILEWAQNKMNEEQELSKIMKKHSGIRDLKEKLDIMVALVHEQEKQES
jgi:hypothetical protein